MLGDLGRGPTDTLLPAAFRRLASSALRALPPGRDPGLAHGGAFAARAPPLPRRASSRVRPPQTGRVPFPRPRPPLLPPGHWGGLSAASPLSVQGAANSRETLEEEEEEAAKVQVITEENFMKVL